MITTTALWSMDHSAIHQSDFVVVEYYSERYRKPLHYLCRVDRDYDAASGTYVVLPYLNRDGSFSEGKEAEAVDADQIVQHVGQPHCVQRGRVRFDGFRFEFVLQ